MSIKHAVKIPLNQDVVSRLARGDHYVPTGRAIMGDELLLVSDEYLRHLVPSKREIALGMAGGFLVGTGAIQTLTLGVAHSALFSLGPIWFVVGVYLFWRQRTMRNVRRSFLKSEEAQKVRQQ